MNIKNAFEDDLKRYWHVEGRDDSCVSDLKRALCNAQHPISYELFVNCLEEMVASCSFDPRDYEKLIGVDFANTEEVANDLKLLLENLLKQQ